MPRTLAFCTDVLSAGGGTRVLVNFARHVDRRLFTPLVVGVGGDRALLDRLAGEPFETRIVPDASRLHTLLAERETQAVLVNRSGRSSPHTRAILEALAGLGERAALLERNIFAEHDASSQAARIDVLTHQTFFMALRYFQRLGREPRDDELPRHAVLTNPVDLERLDAARPGPDERRVLRRSMGIGDDDVVLGQVCRPDTERWDDVLEHVLPGVMRHHPRAFLLLREAPPSRVQRLRRAGGGRCALLPFTRDEAEVYRVIACMDVYAHASRIGEACANAVLEAMALGVPVLTRSTPHAKHCNSQILQVDHDRTGLVASTTAGYGRALGRLLGDTDLRARLGAAGRKKICNEHAPRILAQRLERLVLGVLRKRGSTLDAAEQRALDAVPTETLNATRYQASKAEYFERLRNIDAQGNALERLADRLRAPARLFQRLLDKRAKRRL